MCLVLAVFHVFHFLLVKFLPPANEFRGKVRFSRACVKNSVHGRGCLLQGGACLGGSAPRGCLLRWGVWRPPMMATSADRMHPTGMHSCCYIFFVILQV